MIDEKQLKVRNYLLRSQPSNLEARSNTENTARISKQRQHSPERLTQERISASVYKIWQNQPDIAASIASEVSRMIKSACESKPTFFSGKTEKGILSGLLYHLGLVCNHVKTQRQIARSLNTNEVTVRESWRDWLNEFPELSEDLEERKA